MKESSMSLVRSTRHTGLLRTDDTLLVVIDMQEPFLRDIWACGELIHNISVLVQAARILRIPIVPTLQYAKRMGGIIPDIAKHIPSEYVPFDKLYFSAVGDEAISSEIHRSGRKQILLCGVETHVCVSQTALDLLAQGYQVHVAADAVSSRSQHNRDIGLRRMERAGAVISSTEMAIFELLEVAGTPEFREILPFFKQP
jgi:nicotinamidase-related amidase